MYGGKKNKFYGKVCIDVEVKILSGQMQPLDRLPPLRELAKQTGYSRSVINAGIVELENMGYLKVVPTKWIEVADWAKSGTLAVLEGLMRHNLYTKEHLRSLLESRKLVEGECARLAAQNATQEIIQELYNMVALASSITEAEMRTAYDMDFHRLIGAASGNIVYPLLLKSFGRATKDLVYRFYKMDNIYDFVLARHKEIVNAIANRDCSKAQAKMLQLLAHGEAKCYEDFERRV